MTKEQIHNIFTACISVLGLSVSVEDVSNILNLVLLIISIINLIIILIFKIYNIIHNKALSDNEKVTQIVNDTKDTVEEIKEKLNDNIKRDK